MDIRQADISGKPVLFREATAWGRIRLKPETVDLVREGRLGKGDALAISKTMAVLAAKKTPDMLALCHPLRIERTEVETKLNEDSIEVTVTVSAHEKTGVEMEALTAAAVAALTVYDMCKSVDRGMRIEAVRLTHKAGGKSGEFIQA